MGSVQGQVTTLPVMMTEAMMSKMITSLLYKSSQEGSKVVLLRLDLLCVALGLNSHCIDPLLLAIYNADLHDASSLDIGWDLRLHVLSLINVFMGYLGAHARP